MDPHSCFIFATVNKSLWQRVWSLLRFVCLFFFLPHPNQSRKVQSVHVFSSFRFTLPDNSERDSNSVDVHSSCLLSTNPKTTLETHWHEAWYIFFLWVTELQKRLKTHQWDTLLYKVTCSFNKSPLDKTSKSVSCFHRFTTDIQWTVINKYQKKFWVNINKSRDQQVPNEDNQVLSEHQNVPNQNHASQVPSEFNTMRPTNPKSSQIQVNN